MTTAQDIIQDALEMIGVYSPGDAISSADASRALTVLNDMLDSWSNESLSCYNILEQSGTFVPGQSAYTIGPGGNINATRPLKIQNDTGSAYILDVNNNKYMIDVVDRKMWNMKTTAVANSDLPELLFYDMQFPLGIINVWPTPSIGYTFYFDSFLQLVDFSGLTSVANLPPGYMRAIKANLAAELLPYFRDAQINPLIAIRAMESKGNIKRTNMKTQIAVFDPELVARGAATYNIYADRGG